MDFSLWGFEAGEHSGFGCQTVISGPCCHICHCLSFRLCMFDSYVCWPHPNCRLVKLQLSVTKSPQLPNFGGWVTCTDKLLFCRMLPFILVIINNAATCSVVPHGLPWHEHLLREGLKDYQKNDSPFTPDYNIDVFKLCQICMMCSDLSIWYIHCVRYIVIY